jgi:cytochrome b pre-mRNA-processing protein 3
MFNAFKKRRELKKKARSLYDRAEAQGRLPVFYADLGVPDTVDGRFEMIALNCYILMHRLQATGDKKLSQKLFDAFFKHMDVSLREMGIGDLGVPKHMKRMMQGFNGRANHYEEAIKNSNREELKKALQQNVYGTVDNIQKVHLETMADYVVRNVEVKNAEEGFVAPKLNQELEGKAYA